MLSDGKISTSFVSSFFYFIFLHCLWGVCVRVLVGVGGGWVWGVCGVVLGLEKGREVVSSRECEIML